MTPQAVLYARVARPNDAQLAAQLAACRALALDCGYTVLAELTELGSGLDRQRPMLTRIRQLAGRFDVLVVYDRARLSRDPLWLAGVEQALQRAGVQIVAVAAASCQPSHLHSPLQPAEHLPRTCLEPVSSGRTTCNRPFQIGYLP
jgi:DNA invertase Pin-like site-specific DNA recombinase